MVLTRASAKAVEARSIALQHGADFEPMYEPQDPCADYDWDSCSSALQHAEDFEPMYEPQDPCADCGTFWELTGYDENSGVPQYEKRAW